MKTSIIILSYNEFPETTGRCLITLSDDPAFETWDIIVVDNASDTATRDSLLKAQAQYPAVRFVFNERNLGYAAGNNIGIRMATGEVLILLNSDTAIPSGMIGRLTAHFQGGDEPGMVGPVTNAAGNEQAILTDPGPIDKVIEQGLHYANSGNKQLLDSYRMDFHCVAISRKVIDAVGLLDEEFGRGYYEDFDYSLRVKQAGFGLCVAEDVFVYHRGSASFRKFPRETKELLKRNKKRILSKHGSQVLFPHQREGNLSILAQYAEIAATGLSVPENRIRNRLEYAARNQPKSFFKRWRYSNKVRKIAGKLNLEVAL